MKLRKSTALVSLLTLLAAPGLAAAHPVIDAAGGYGAGFMHPFTGLDHMLAMFTVGLWAATLGGKAAWRVPAAFVVMLIVGAGLGMTGMHLPFVEPLIAVSVLALGLAVTLTLKVTPRAGMAVVGLFAMFHGFAHGAELPEAVSGYAFLAGMVSASVILHVAGYGIGNGLKRHAWLLRAGGAMIAGTGIWLLAAV